MRGAVSPGTGQHYPLTMICAVFRVPRSMVYQTRVPAGCARLVATKRGPKTRWSDAEVVGAIRAVLAATPFHGEGYRKVRARLAHRGLALGGKRVLRLMRGHHLLAPRRLGLPHGDPAHAGTITTTRPDEMWGTDATRFYTEQDGWCWFFGAIDHCIDELVGWHTAKIGDRQAGALTAETRVLARIPEGTPSLVESESHHELRQPGSRQGQSLASVLSIQFDVLSSIPLDEPFDMASDPSSYSSSSLCRPVRPTGAAHNGHGPVTTLAYATSSTRVDFAP